jgi:deazaflavin-dependent oxidoreductase (nitroreductase family)
MTSSNESSGGSSNLGAWISRLRERRPEVTLADGPDEIDQQALDTSVGFAAEHARRYVLSGGTDDGWDGPRPILILYTTGRRSGQLRRNPVLYFDHEGRRYVVASKGGAAENPQWFTNLVAQPDVYVRAGAEVYRARAVVAPVEERTDVWPALVEGYPMFAEYQAATARQIPLVRLDPVQP